MALRLAYLPTFLKSYKALSAEFQIEAQSLIAQIHANNGKCPDHIATGKANCNVGHTKVKVIICKPTDYRLSFCIHQGQLVLIHVATRENYYDKQKPAIEALPNALKRL